MIKGANDIVIKSVWFLVSPTDRWFMRTCLLRVRHTLSISTCGGALTIAAKPWDARVRDCRVSMYALKSLGTSYVGSNIPI